MYRNCRWCCIIGIVDISFGGMGGYSLEGWMGGGGFEVGLLLIKNYIFEDVADKTRSTCLFPRQKKNTFGGGCFNLTIVLL